MVPGGFLLYQFSIEKKPAVIVQTGDEIPRLIGVGRELMVRGIVLNKLADVLG